MKCQKVSVRPTISDHGKKLDCRAAIFDAESKIVYDWKSAPATSLNVTFPPQGVKNTTVEGHLGDNVTLAVTFISNPMPDKLRFQLMCQDCSNKAKPYYNRICKNFHLFIGLLFGPINFININVKFCAKVKPFKKEVVSPLEL